MIPISEKHTQNRKRKSESKRVKLPTSMRSEHQKKCPICHAPYIHKCYNCGYTNLIFDLEASRLHTEELFRRGSEIKT